MEGWSFVGKAVATVTAPLGTTQGARITHIHFSDEKTETVVASLGQTGRTEAGGWYWTPCDGLSSSDMI